jgi:hypothetical protein
VGLVNTAAWNQQIICAKMFGNLIHNTDPNLGKLARRPSLESHLNR